MFPKLWRRWQKALMTSQNCAESLEYSSSTVGEAGLLTHCWCMDCHCVGGSLSSVSTSCRRKVSVTQGNEICRLCVHWDLQYEFPELNYCSTKQVASGIPKLFYIFIMLSLCLCVYAAYGCVCYCPVICFETVDQFSWNLVWTFCDWIPLNFVGFNSLQLTNALR